MLRSEILAPTHTHLRDCLVAALGCGAIALAAIVTEPKPRLHDAASPPTIVLRETPTVSVSVATGDEVAQPLHSDELQLVFSAGAETYMVLGDTTAAHGKPRLVSGDDLAVTSIAEVADEDVPTPYRVWKQRKVRVDNRCETTVTGFAVVARLTGDTGYSDVTEGRWTARNVMEHGSRVLAARLAGCTGTYARDAALPNVIELDELRSERLAARATAKLLASTVARDTQAEWAASDGEGNWWQAPHAKLSTRVLEHPTTGVTWVSVHGSTEYGCGEPEVNVWGLFRVDADGQLRTVQLRKLGDLHSIDRIIDIDNDGELELIGKPWLGLDTVVTRANGDELHRLSLPFFGCPC